jgi:hypothetical protein
MKKGEIEGLKKLKLEDYDIGRTLGRGNFHINARWFW